MSYYDFSSSSPAMRRPQRSKTGLLAVVIVAALVWGGAHLILGHHTQPKLPTAAIEVVALPDVETEPAPVAAAPKASPAKTEPSMQFHALVEPAQQQAHSAPAAGHHVYSLQVATSASSDAAQELAQRLTGLHFPAKLISSQSGTKDQWNQVVVGPFNRSETAYLAQKKLQKLGFRGVLLISK